MAAPAAQVCAAANQSQPQPQCPSAAMQQSAQAKQQELSTEHHMRPLDSKNSGVAAAAGVISDANNISCSLKDNVAVKEGIREQPCSNADMHILQYSDGDVGKADPGSVATSPEPVQRSMMGDDDLGQQLLDHSQAGRYASWQFQR